MTLLRLLFALLLLATAGRIALADDAATRTAKRHFERGEKLYALAKFNEAIGEYQEAYDARPLPDFLFNIGQCYRNLGDYEAAIFSYQKYLKLAPDAPNRSQVEQLISDLQARAEKRDAERLRLQQPRPLEPAPVPPTTDPAHAASPPPGSREPAGPGRSIDQPLYTRWWFWTGIAVVGMAGGVGIYEVTRPDGPPSTTLGNIVFGK